MSDITYFDRGDDVPRWLLKAAPKRVDSVMGTFKFQRPAAVVRVKDRLWMIPVDDIFNPGDFVRLDGADGVNVSAADDNLAIAVARPSIEFFVREREAETQAAQGPLRFVGGNVGEDPYNNPAPAKNPFAGNGGR